MVAECKYKELDSYLIEQFINRLNKNHMVCKIIHELTLIDDKSTLSSDEVLAS